MEISLDALSSTLGTWFAPEYGGNREKPEAERMAVRLSPLTGRELKAVRSATKVSLKPKKESDFVALIEAREDAVGRELLSKHILEVRNLSSRKAGVVTPIADGAGLVELCLSGPPSLLSLAEEILAALMDTSKLEEGVLKN